MANRGKVVKDLQKLKITPNDVKNYAFHVTKELKKEFKISDDNYSDQNEKLIESVATEFAKAVKKMYVKATSNFKVMLKQKQTWFEGVITNPLTKPTKPKSPTNPTPKKKGRRKSKPKGRHKKDYLDNQSTQQWTKADKIIGNNSLEQMIHASMLKASRDGDTDTEWLLRQIRENPKIASEIRQTVENPVKPVIVLTPDECLAEVLESRLTERSYKRLRKKQKAQNAKIFVSWEDVCKAKKIRKPQNIDSTSKKGEISVPMQDVCNHQIKNIMDFPEVKEKVRNLNESGRQFKLVMFGKYGADGTATDTDYQTADAGEFSYLNVLQCSNNFRKIQNA